MSKILRQWISEEELRAVSTRCVGTPFHHRESVFPPRPSDAPFPADVDIPILRGRERGGESFYSPQVCVNARTRGPRPSSSGLAPICTALPRRVSQGLGERDCRKQLPRQPA